MVHLHSNLWVVDVALSPARKVTDPLSAALFLSYSRDFWDTMAALIVTGLNRKRLPLLACRDAQK